MLFSLEGGENRREQIRGNQLAPGLFFAAQPNEYLARGRMFANTSFEHCPKLGMLTGFIQNARNLGHHSAVGSLHQVQRALRPARAKCSWQRLQNAFLLRRRQVWQYGPEAFFLVEDQFCKSQTYMRGVQGLNTGEQIIPCDD